MLIVSKAKMFIIFISSAVCLLSADCLLGQILFRAAGHLENFPSCYSSVGHPVVLETLLKSLLKSLLRFQQSYWIAPLDCWIMICEASNAHGKKVRCHGIFLHDPSHLCRHPLISEELHLLFWVGGCSDYDALRGVVFRDLQRNQGLHCYNKTPVNPWLIQLIFFQCKTMTLGQKWWREIFSKLRKIMLICHDTFLRACIPSDSCSYQYPHAQYAMVGQPKSERFPPKPVWAHCIKFPQLQDT